MGKLDLKELRRTEFMIAYCKLLNEYVDILDDEEREIERRLRYALKYKDYKFYDKKSILNELQNDA